MKKRLSILGVTGSIGKSALKVCDHFKNEIQLIGICVHHNITELLKIIDQYHPLYAVIFDEKAMLHRFQSEVAEYHDVKIYSGKAGLKYICSDKNNQIIINGISGYAGLSSSVMILESGIHLALANKESVVCAGPILHQLAKEHNCRIIPVDSEHSAIFQLMQNRIPSEIKNLYLTASGGPFLRMDKKEWYKITLKDALQHPTWQMGNKITIDSATMANKGLEVIEAHYLFGIDYNRIKVLIHPQSLIHSMIETIDGEIYAQLGPNDMSLPIQNAIFYPELKSNQYKCLDFTSSINLELIPVDMTKFKMLSFAYQCGQLGNLFPVFFNAVNESLVHLFLNNQISFLKIEEWMEKAIDTFLHMDELNKADFTLENIQATDHYAQYLIKKLYKDL